jgi:hypothetical protein
MEWLAHCKKSLCLYASVCYLFHASFLHGFFFSLECPSDMFLRNVGWLSADYTALYPRRENSANCGSAPMLCLGIEPTISIFSLRNYMSQTARPLWSSLLNRLLGLRFMCPDSFGSLVISPCSFWRPSHDLWYCICLLRLLSRFLSHRGESGEWSQNRGSLLGNYSIE